MGGVGGSGSGGMGVQEVGFEEIAADGHLGGDELPFELGGETMAAPAGEGVGFKEAEVADGGFGEFFEGLPAAEGEDAPAGAGGGVATPVERRLPALALGGVPAFGEPEFGAVVAVLVEKGEELGAGGEPGGDAEGRDVDGVAGGLVVEGEAFDGFGVGGDADFDHTGAAG